jgi:hypothetical protein
MSAQKSNYVHALLWASAVVGSFYLETFWYAKIRYIREVSFFDYRLTIIAVSMLIFTISVLLIYKIQERESKKNMSKEKQIEEMAKAMCRNGMSNGNCAMDDDPCALECVYGCCAESLYNAGYRKQSEGEWHFYSDDFSGKQVTGWICGNCNKYSTGLCNYCPECGAKMKGEKQ